MAPFIDNVKKIPLTAPEEQVLKGMFAKFSRLVISGEFSGGFGGARVLQVIPVPGAKQPVVVKLGPKDTIDREWQAFDTTLKGTLPNTLGVQGEPVYVDSLGGLCYPLSGSGVFKVTPLEEYLQTSSLDDIRYTLDRLMKVLESMVRHHEVRGQHDMRLCYDLLLPLNLLIAQEPPPPEVTPQVIDPNHLPDTSPQPGAYVRVEGFHVVKSDHKNRNVTLNVPKPREENEDEPGNTYQIRLEPVDIDLIPGHSETIPPIEGKVVHNRASYLQSKIETAFDQPVDLTGSEVTFSDGTILDNPLKQLSYFLDEKRHNIKWAKIHGDMNLGNVLVDVETGDVNIIDYSEARTDYALHDFLRLETEIVLKIFLKIVSKRNFGLVSTIQTLYQQLHWVTFYAGADQLKLRPQEADLVKPFEILRVIRKSAQRYLFSFEDHDEYYYGLIVYLLGTLKFKERSSLSKRVAFIAAATLTGLINNELGEWLPPSPYRGLQVFDVEHAAYFFGREDLTNDLLDRLREMIGLGAERRSQRTLPFSSSKKIEQPLRLLALVGASGSGKSSLARAGIIGSLRQGRIEGSETWPLVICRPGNNSLESLALTLLDTFESHPRFAEIDRLVDNFAQDEQTLHLIVEEVLAEASDSQRVLIFIDQFEEIFSLEKNIERRQAFLANLSYAAQIDRGRTIFLFTLRGDFYVRFAAHKEFRLEEHHIVVAPLKEHQLRQAIERPAQQAGCAFEDGLVEKMVQGVLDQPGSLPLLQHALMLLWQTQLRRQDDDKAQRVKYQPLHKRLITREAYDLIGGWVGALEQQANKVYRELAVSQQTLCRDIFLQLVRTGEGDEVNRQPARLQELLGLGNSSEDVWAVINTLADERARLLTIINPRDETGHKNELGTSSETQVEMAHEALIHHWPRLESWIEENREAIRIRDKLVEAARTWQNNEEDEGYLFRGVQLAKTEEWAEKPDSNLGVKEKEFLDASIAERDRAVREERERLQRELEQQQTLLERERDLKEEQRQRAESEHQRAEAQTIATRRARFALAMAVVLTLSAILGGVMFRLQAERETSIRLAEAANANLSTDPELSILLAQQALKTSHTEEAEQSLYQAVQRSHVRQVFTQTSEIRSVAYHPNGLYLATGTRDGTVTVWDLNSGQEWFSLTLNNLFPIEDDKISVWDVAFSPDGSWLAVGSSDDVARIWNFGDREIVFTLTHTASVRSLAFGPENQLLVTASNNGIITVWEVPSLREEPAWKMQPAWQGHSDHIMDVAFSPNGELIATAGGEDDKTIRIWETATGNEFRTFEGHEDQIDSVHFSPDGKLLVSGSRDETVRIWDVEKGTELRLLGDQSSQIWDATFSNDGTRLAIAEGEGTVKIRNQETGQLLLTLSGHTEAVRRIAFSPDGSSIATASWDGTVRIWDVSSHSDVVKDVAFSPDGQFIATASKDRTANLWDATTGKLEATFERHQGLVRRVLFSPNGLLVATAGEDNTARLWDVATGQEALQEPLRHDNWVYGLAFSPDGRRLATASYDNTAAIWDIVSGQRVFTLTGHTNDVNDVAYSPDGSLIATASFDNSVRLWNASSGQPIRDPLEYNDDVTGLAFSPDGETLVTVGVEGAWVLAVPSYEKLFELEGHNKWVRDVAFSSDGKHVVTGSYDNTIRIWDTASRALVKTIRHTTDVNSVDFKPKDPNSNASEIVAATSADSAVYFLYPLDLSMLQAIAQERLDNTKRQFTPEECTLYLDLDRCPAP